MTDRNDQPPWIRTHRARKGARPTQTGSAERFCPRNRRGVGPSTRPGPERRRIALCQIRIPWEPHLVEVGLGIDWLTKTLGNALGRPHRASAAPRVEHDRTSRCLEARSERIRMPACIVKKHLLLTPLCIGYALESTMA